jgi:hypothetical protein
MPPSWSSRQRRPLRRHQDAFPRRVLSPLQELLPLSRQPLGLAPPPRRCLAFAVAAVWRRRIIDNPPPCSRLCRREPASNTLSPPSTCARHEAGRLDPTLTLSGAGLDQVLLVDFCNQNNPRAQPQDRPIPGPLRRRSAPSLRWAGRKPPDGFDAIRHTDHRLQVAPPDASISANLAARRGWTPVETEASSDASCFTNRGLTGQGLASFRRPAPPVWRRACAT